MGCQLVGRVVGAGPTAEQTSSLRLVFAADQGHLGDPSPSEHKYGTSNNRLLSNAMQGSRPTFCPSLDDPLSKATEAIKAQLVQVARSLLFGLLRGPYPSCHDANSRWTRRRRVLTGQGRKCREA